jgi:phosphatidylglycerophosphate synthase
MKIAERVERIRESPWRYAIPWSMTVARPILGELGRRAAEKGHKKTATVLFAAAAFTDLEGIPARYFNATSRAGAIGDPVADGILRAQILSAVGDEMPITAGLVFTEEVGILELNSSVQKGRETPFVPQLAKAGTVVQLTGAVLAYASGEDQTAEKLLGKGGMHIGTRMRKHAYAEEKRRMNQRNKL